MIEREVIKTWEDGTVLYIEDNEYRLDGVWGTAKLSVCRTSVGNFVTSSIKEVPKMLLAEIGHNI